MAHPAVAMAACIGMKHPKWDERPIVAVVKKPGAEVTREELLAFYEGKIAKWQIPDDVVFVDAIPLGATGKMLKTRLREHAQGLPAAERLMRSGRCDGRGLQCRTAALPCHLRDSNRTFRAIPWRCTAQKLVPCALIRSTRRHPMKFDHEQSLQPRHAGGRRRAPFAQKGETVKMVRIDPLSGLLGPVGRQASSRATSSSPRSSAARATRPASSSKSPRIDNKLSPRRKPERAEGRHRPGRALHHPGQRLVGARWPLIRRGRQAQRAQSRQGGALPQLRGGGPGPDQQQVQLLALPLRRRHLHEDGSA